MKHWRAGSPFIVFGLAFLVLGIITNLTFFYGGIIFVFAGLLVWARDRR